MTAPIVAAPAPCTIPKLAQGSAYDRPLRGYPSARAAMRAFLAAARLLPGERVLLPGYIGWSPREGSGVFDPVRELGVAHDFYRMDRALRIDLDDLARAFRGGGVRVLVLIHYFGAPDPNAAAAVALAREHGALVLEDEAHAMLTDLIAGECGRAGDAAIFSLHKLLPVAAGGALVLNCGPAELPLAGALGDAEPLPRGPWSYDLAAIAGARRRNAAALDHLVRTHPGLCDEIEPLWPALDPQVVPQTYPVRIRHVSRDALYFRMNGAGFGVVSLYHTMIDELDPARHADAHALAHSVMNLPVHQDTGEEELHALADELAHQIQALRRGEG